MLGRMSLDGNWELAGFLEGQGDWSWPEDHFPIAAPVPGEVHPALQEAGLIPDPSYGTNAGRVRWVEEREWWYRRRFRVPAGFTRTQSFLEFDGLDTFATVLLNGEVVGEASNMFVPCRFDVTRKLKEHGENTLEVRFAPAAKIAERTSPKDLYVRYNPIRVGVRKMQAQFGWDWLPRLIGAGIWRPVRLTSYDRLSVRDVHVQSDVTEGAATVCLAVELDNHLSVPVSAVVSAGVIAPDERPGGRAEKHVLVGPGGGVVRLEVPLADPQLWWPNGLGEQPLYAARIELRADTDLVDERELRFALRTVELRQQREDGQPAFLFVVNGEPVFARGANWIPADGFPSRVTTDRYEALLEMACQANLNMLRVWGGGIYEQPDFYDLCDELGIMVWQDFMFSLAEYPETEAFTGMVAREASAVVRRLRNHPCLVLWCGNNECEMDTEANAVWRGKRLFHDTIARIVRQLDPGRVYWPSSPYGGEIAHSSEHGDYHGEPWFHVAKLGPDHWRECLEKDRGLFMSEFPTQGPPEVESIRRFMPAGSLFPVSGAAWEEHLENNAQRQERTGYTSRELLLRNIRAFMGEPETIEEFARLGGILQGEFLASQIEFYRRHKGTMGGALFWMFGEAWPAVSYGVVDHYLRPKPAYYYVKRACAPVLLSFDHQGGEAEAWIVNDRLEPVQGLLSVGRVAGGVLAGPMERLPVTVADNSIQRVWSGPAADDPAEEWLIGMLDMGGRVVGRASHFFSLPRQVGFPAPAVHLQQEYLDGILIIAVAGDTYTRAISLEGLPDQARPDDNYFDLFPGEVRRIGVAGLSPEEAAQVRVITGQSVTPARRGQPAPALAGAR
ncbi:MAG TPA: glycoside hydrolase family 2 TIM barrel-domain containing protein [Armatimonadota bacterium]|nr:glycoside hydrolase family 2 TIM barrel-domain containing protein [Armatimonadota bacterium]HOQ27333.1 glycoside hydrolase family 2 TIM barrel-domain containing protein [Armatimonadota bacterium]HPO73529.1 glycoside hydrolase family 2 TIM barrel-domain containing protein [Armatimonadota bacterium]